MKTTAFLLTVLSLLAVLTPMKAKAQSVKSSLTESSLKYEIKRSGEMRYLLYLPKDYDAKGNKQWPLMLFLHGAGERGTNLQRVAIHGPPMLAKNGTNFPFIVVAPQCPEGQRWENDSLLQLLDHVMKTCKVDASRVYLTGLSMGGYGTWKLGLAHPEKFAAIVPICGGGERIDVLLAGRERAAALRDLGVWAFHGAKDPVVPLEESERMVDAFKKAGVKEVKFTVYPEADHNSWTAAYNDPELYAWLLKHQRNATAAANR
jgi:predicted peptidase